jgi:cytochrome c2
MKNKKEQKARIIALWAIAGMVVIWIVLGIFSFTDTPTHHRPQTTEVSFEGQTALRGKQVLQAYNCMDCHTIVGNGGYFAPDLTKIYKEAGPAWLKAYLGSPATYPTKAIVNIQLKLLQQEGQTKITDLDQYFTKYTGAERRVDHRGGIEALMPNLRFSKDEISALIAFFKYTAELNTAGWPPEVIARKSVIEQERRKLELQSGVLNEVSAGTSGNSKSTGAETTVNDPAASGKLVAANLGCTACHSTNGTIKVGPSWKGLYNSTVSVTGGKTVQADTAYISRSILDPNADVVKGFQKGVMPSYKGLISEKDLSDLEAYIKSLK